MEAQIPSPNAPFPVLATRGQTLWKRERHALKMPIQSRFIESVETFLMTVWTFSVTKTKSNLQDAPEPGCTVCFSKLG